MKSLNSKFLKRFMKYCFENIERYGVIIETINEEELVGLKVERIDQSLVNSKNGFQIIKKYKKNSSRSKAIQFGRCQSEAVLKILEMHIDNFFNDFLNNNENIISGIKTNLFTYGKRSNGDYELKVINATFTEQIYEIRKIREISINNHKNKIKDKNIFNKKESERLINILIKAFNNNKNKFDERCSKLVEKYIKSTQEYIKISRLKAA